MRKVALILSAVIALLFVHEGMHALTAFIYDEYGAFHMRFYGGEVTYRTPVSDRQGGHWAIIAGASYVATIGLGYFLFSIRRRFAAAGKPLIRHLGYWLLVIFMLGDPFSLVVNPFIFGGDVGGIAVGLGISKYFVQAFAFIILMLNRELVVQKVFPLFGAKTLHPLLKPLIPLPGTNPPRDKPKRVV